jgi:glycolate oxidase
VSRLKKEFGDEKVIVEGSSFADYAVDMADYRATPLAVVKIESEGDVVKAVRMANELLVPIVARGAGSSLTGAVVSEGAIVLDMRGFARVLKIDTVNYYAQVEPGITLDDLDKELEKKGFFLPPDPASSYLCTIGGAISEGSGGMRCVRYGTMKDWVMALRVVLGSGAVVQLGEPLAKNRAGYDLMHLLVGSEGTLGIVTEAYLKIVPVATAKNKRVLALFDKWEDAGRAIADVRSSRVLPGMMEFMDRFTVNAVNRALEMNLEEAEATLLVDIEEFHLEELVKLFEKNGARKVVVAKDEEEAEKFYQARVWVYPSVKVLASGAQVEDVVVPIDRLAEYLTWVKQLAEKYSLTISVVGHAGDGNVHPTILYDKEDPKMRDAANSAFEEICRHAISMGGSVTGEHGVGIQKVRLFREQLAAHDGLEALRLMKEIKRLFDPNGIMNPGKYVEAA